MNFARTTGVRIRGRKRVLICSHDTYGLGHLRRSLLLAGRLAAFPQVASILIATGSPRAQAFQLPRGCDTVKLPAVTKSQAGRYRARTLGLPIREVTRLRSELVKSLFEAFRPDLILVDHAPLGMLGELGPLIQQVHRTRPRPRMVLGLRDVIDQATSVDAEWSRVGAWDAVETAYDRVLVYGDPSVTTTGQELGLPERLPGRVVHVGYLGRAIPPVPRPKVPSILVTAGGGGDGHDLLRAYADFLEELPAPAPFRSVVVTGPLMSRRRRQELSARFQDLPHRVEVHTFADGLEEKLAEASGVLSMAGYNTVVETMSARKPVLLVPRESPRLEQRIRAERVAERVSSVRWCTAEECTPDRILSFVEWALAGPDGDPISVALDGVDRAVIELLAALDREGDGATRKESVSVSA